MAEKNASKKNDQKFDYNSIKPDEAPKDSVSAVKWQEAEQNAIAAATSDSALAAAVASPEAAAALLSRVRGAYASDAVALAQIAAVTQFAMRPGVPPASRAIWESALLARIGSVADPYVKTFCLDQLRWCGGKTALNALDGIRTAAAAANDGAVRDMAVLTARHIRSACGAEK